MKNREGDANGDTSRRKQGKRRLAEYKSSKEDLAETFRTLSKCFRHAVHLASKRLANFPLPSRARTLEVNIVQSCFAEVASKFFIDKISIGKYGRIILKEKGYLILFKKLDKRSFPMNTKTKNVQLILNQSQTLDLFAETEYEEDPILYFGYLKDKFGEYVSPKLVYIDDESLKFSINQEETMLEQIPFQNNEPDPGESPKEVTPKLKGNKKTKKAN